MPNEHTLYLDIETLPGPKDCLDWKTFAPRGNLKDPEKIEADIAEKKAAALDKTSFDGGWGEVCVIGFALNEDRVRTQSVCGQAEGEAIDAFFGIADAGIGSFDRVTACGHNVTFDLEFLKKRAIIHGIELPKWFPVNFKPWDKVIRDTMTLWDSRKESKASLDELCRILGIEGKDGFDGSMVAEAWANGEYSKVAEYCMSDVEKVRKINKRFLEVGI